MKFNFFIMIGIFLLMLIIPFKFDFKWDKHNLENQEKEAITETIETIETDLKTKIRVKDEESGEIKAFSQRDFVFGSVCSEVPPSFSEEAIKAQAVCSHSYGLYSMKLRQEEDFDVLAPKGKMDEFDLKKQYGNKYSQYYKKMKKCCDEVFDYGVFYEDEIALSCYHAMCAGKTVSSEDVWGKSLPYLIPVRSYGDEKDSQFETETSFTYDQFKELIRKRYPDTLFLKSKDNIIKIIDKTPSNYVKMVKIGKTDISGKEIRDILSLRSTNFEIKPLENEIVFVTKGYGHGVGMSQVGANFMAESGMNFQEILEHYFSGARVLKMKNKI